MGTHIIAELGQNHNGSRELARELIDIAAQPIVYEERVQLPGCNAVKFQVRDLDHELTPEAAAAPYDSKHSFGDTYGEHRRNLELPLGDYEELADHARLRGLEVVVTCCQHTIVDDVARYIQPDAWKVASRDIGNGPLLNKLAWEEPDTVIISTGMATHRDIRLAIDVFRETRTDVWLMHCVSSYPCRYRDLGLRAIIDLHEYQWDGGPVTKIGYSDHTSGVMAPALAVVLGATVIEKHITLSHDMKGSDHAGSMDREGFRRVVRDIRNAECANTQCDRLQSGKLSPTEEATHAKIGRSVAYRANYPEGKLLQQSDFVMVSPPQGLKWDEVLGMIGKPLRRAVSKNALVLWDDV